jgi:hypothetical protein
MIEEPPPLVFGPAVERPSAKLVEGFRGAPTSFLVDAMGGSGALDWRIKPLVGRSLVGVAHTCGRFRVGSRLAGTSVADRARLASLVKLTTRALAISVSSESRPRELPCSMRVTDLLGKFFGPRADGLLARGLGGRRHDRCPSQGCRVVRA